MVRAVGALALAVLLLVVGPATAADPVAHRPLHVVRASFTQDGQQVVWHVELGHSFSAAGLKERRRSLCLQLERVRRMTPFAVLCLWQGRGGRQMRLV